MMEGNDFYENIDFYDDIFIKKIVPSVIEGKRITWELCVNIFEKYQSSYSSQYEGLREYVVMKEIFTRIDQSICFPSDSDFKNFKRKIKPSRKNDKNIIDNFYPRKNIIGEFCESVGLSPVYLDKICKQEHDNDVLQFKASCTVTYNIALELFKFIIIKKSLSSDDLLNIIAFLSGREREEKSDKNLLERIRYFYKKVQNFRSSISNSSVKQSITEKLSTNVFAEEILEENLDDDNKRFRKTISEYEKQLYTVRKHWDAVTKRNENLYDLLRKEKSSNLENSRKCDELELKLKDSEKECQEACRSLRTLVANSSAICTVEIHRKQASLDEEISRLKKENSEMKEKYDELHAKHIEMIDEVSTKNDEIQGFAEKIVKEKLKKRQLQKMKSFYLKKIQKLEDGAKSFDLDSRISELRNEIAVLENEKSSLQFELNNFMESEPLVLKNQDGSYKNKIRACYQDLVLSGVGIKQTQNVIISVLKNLASIEVSETELPGTTFARSQFEEARLLAFAQLGTTLSKGYQSANNTLQSDGTSKFGKHYGTYDVRVKSGENLVLGVRPMVTGDSETVLSELLTILKDVEDVCSGTDNNIGKKVLLSIKNTMSDRHVVQKKFNKMLQEYRCKILPEIVEDWASLPNEEQNKMKVINSLFCGLHYVVGLADQSESALKVFDKLMYEGTPVGSLVSGGSGYNKGDSGTTRLIRTLCKAVENHGCEKSGRMVDFDLALEEDGIDKNPLAQFRGNRFNIIFYNGGAAYYLHKTCLKFFDNNDDNNLLKAVCQDLKVDSYIAGCRALGLVNKFLTGPLWRLLVKVKNVLSLNKYYQRIADVCKQISEDASDLLKGNVIFFDDFEGGLITKDHIYESLIHPCEEYDDLTKQILEIMFGSFAIITKRMLHDHLSGGKFSQPSAEQIEEVESCPTTNVFPESNFGILDRLMREKPNANEITYESVIMCKSNRMSQWRDSLSNSQKDYWMNWVKKSRKKHYKQFIERRKVIRKLRNDKRLSKLENKKRKEIRIRQAKVDLCSKIESFGGLWKTVQDIDFHFEKIKNEKEKISALKCQLQFRQKVLLESNNVDSSLFKFSCNKVSFSSTKLRENLQKVISCVDELNVDFQVNSDKIFVPLPSVISVEKLTREKERLKELLVKECAQKTEVNEPRAKKQKTVVHKSVTERNKNKLPEVEGIHDLVGKRVCHLSTDDNGKPRWFDGTVICVKPDSNYEEMVIRYDGYQTLYSFDFSEFSESLLKLIPLEPDHVVGKCIMHKFTDENESDEWHENGKIISFLATTGLFTINYFDLNDSELPVEDHEDEDLSVYETLNIEFDEFELDYLNHDIRFV